MPGLLDGNSLRGRSLHCADGAAPAGRQKRGYRPRGPVAVGTPSPSGSSPASPAADPGQPEAAAAAHGDFAPEDKRQQSAGDKLNTTEVINMEDSHLSDRELQQEDFDAVFRPRQGDILAVLMMRAAMPSSKDRSQSFSRPAHRQSQRRAGRSTGLPARSWVLACVRKVVQSLSFPVSNKSQVVTYPFALR